MANLSFSDAGGTETRAKQLGDIAVRVEAFDARSKTLTGTDASTGEEVSIRLSTLEEFASHYVPGDKGFDAKLDTAKAKTESRQSMADAFGRAGEDGVVLLSQVKELSNGERIARWPNALVTQPDNEAYFEGTIRFSQRDRKNEQGTVIGKTATLTATFPEAARPLASLQKSDFDQIMNGTAPGVGGDVTKMVVVGVELQGEVKGSALFQPDLPEGQGLANGIDAALSRKLNKYSAMAATVVAAQVGKDFNELDLSDSGIGEDRRAFLGKLYDAVQGGDINSSVTEGFTANLMPKIRQRLLDEKKPANDMLDRGFFEGRFVLRLDPNWEDGASPVMTTAVSIGWLEDKRSEDFQSRKLDSVAAVAIDNIAERPAPTQEQSAKAEQPAPEPRNDPKPQEQPAPTMVDAPPAM